jgi:hypothetical protein
MTAADLIAAFRQPISSTSVAELTTYFAFQPLQPQYGYATDANQLFRAVIVNALLPDFSLTDHGLIRALFAEEMKCEAAIREHENLYQLSFYLYELGQFEDTFPLYEAKYRTQNMDVHFLLDREMMTVRHEVPDVICYVEAEFLREPLLRTRYPTILEELNGMLEHPDYNSVEDYRTFIRGYFYGHEDEDSDGGSTDTDTVPTASLSGYEPRPKPWWKFW